MKKIVFGLALLLSMVVCAGQVKWAATNVFGTDGTTKNGGVGYLFVDTQVSELNALLAGSDASAAQTWVVANAISSVTPGTAGTYSSAAVDYTAGTYNFVAVIFDAATVADASNYYVTTAKQGSVPGSGSATVSFGNQSTRSSAAGAYTSAGWAASDVPEPTSGLLLLLGGALLALRRKQK